MALWADRYSAIAHGLLSHRQSHCFPVRRQVTLSRLHPNCSIFACVLSLSPLITIFTGPRPSYHSKSHIVVYIVNTIIMSPSTLTRAAFAAGLLVSSVAATYDAASKTNIAMYWGQGNAQIPLSEVCADPNIDIVNIGCK